MKHLLLTTIAAVLLVGCGESPPTAKAPDISIHEAAMFGNTEAIQQHLAAGTDVNAKYLDRSVPLHNAANYGHKEVVELLIAAGADVNAKNKNEWTHLSAAAVNGHKDIVELLIAEGADVNENESGGGTPLDWANDKELADLIRKHGGKPAEELKAEGN